MELHQSTTGQLIYPRKQKNGRCLYMKSTRKKELTYGLEGDLDDGMLFDRYHICTAFHLYAFVHESSNCTI